MRLNKIYVSGSGTIPEYLIGLGMVPFVFTDAIPSDAECVIYVAPFVDAQEVRHLRLLSSLSYLCLLKQVPMIFVSDDSVFGDGFDFLENGKKNPQDLHGMTTLTCEAVVKVDTNKTIRVQRGHVPSGIFSYIEKFNRMPQTLHLGTGTRLSIRRAMRLGIYD